MSIKEALSWAKTELKGTLEPGASALVLISDVLNMNRAQVFANLLKKLTPLQSKKFKEFVKKRKAHEPVWQIIGKVKFWGHDFHVNRDVLVPRPETELLVERALKEIMSYELRLMKRGLRANGKYQKLKSTGANENWKPMAGLPNPLKIKNPKISILDMGTGSGAIAISLAREMPNAKITAADISKKALRVASRNIKKNKVSNVTLIESDLFKNIVGKYDLICANLPYIPSSQMSSLDMDVHHYEPRIALCGGANGLAIYEKFFATVGRHLNQNGIIICEIGDNQGREVRLLLKKHLPKSKVRVISDFARIDRIVIINNV